MSTANVVDSAGWLEYFTDSDRASLFAAAIEDTRNLLVPAISIYEVFKKVLRVRGENDALQVASLMQGSQVIDLDCALALEAARHPCRWQTASFTRLQCGTKRPSGRKTTISKTFPMCAFFQRNRRPNLPVIKRWNFGGD